MNDIESLDGAVLAQMEQARAGAGIRLGDFSFNTSAPRHITFERMINAQGLKGIVIIVSSTCPDTIAIHVVGGPNSSPRDAARQHKIGNPLYLPPGNVTYQERAVVLSFDAEDTWYPWIGIYGRNLTVDGAAAGRIVANAYLRY